METKTLQTILVNWLHLSAAMIWLGAVFTGAAVFFHKRGDGMQASSRKLSAAFYRVFSPYAWGALAVLVLTGALRAAGHLEGGVAGLFTTPWGRLLTLKLILILLMVCAGAYATYVLAPRIDVRPAAATDAKRNAALEERLRFLTLFTAIMGAGVLFIVTLL